MKTVSRTILAHCPICKTVVPVVFVKVLTGGWWRKDVKIEIEGDATDYIAHLWAHSQGMNDYPSVT